MLKEAIERGGGAIFERVELVVVYCLFGAAATINQFRSGGDADCGKKGTDPFQHLESWRRIERP